MDLTAYLSSCVTPCRAVHPVPASSLGLAESRQVGPSEAGGRSPAFPSSPRYGERQSADGVVSRLLAHRFLTRASAPRSQCSPHVPLKLAKVSSPEKKIAATLARASTRGQPCQGSDKHHRKPSADAPFLARDIPEARSRIERRRIRAAPRTTCLAKRSEVTVVPGGFRAGLTSHLL
jgi:hypothetical protein